MAASRMLDLSPQPVPPRNALSAALVGAPASGLSPERELELVVAVEAGDRQAGHELVHAFSGAIAGLARRYDGFGIPREELLQDGVVGLLYAARRFDPRLETRFWTYASWWVRKAMQEHAAEVHGAVALSDHAVRALSRVRASRRELRARTGSEPSAAELSTATGLDRRQLEALLAVDRGPLALDEPLDVGSETTLLDAVVDPAAERAYEEVLDRLEQSAVCSLLELLDDRQRSVLADHYGLSGDPRTLSEIGRRLGVSAERARQIEADALRALRGAAAAGRARIASPEPVADGPTVRADVG